MMISLTVGLIKRTLYIRMSQYLPKPFNKDINVNVNLSNYATKTDLKNINLDYFRGKSHFDQDGTQNYLVFHSILKYFTINNSSWVKSLCSL